MSGHPEYQITAPSPPAASSKGGGATIWLTGLTGAGKSTIAYALKRRLVSLGATVELLDGNVIRTNLSEGLGFSKEDRFKNIRRIGFVCHLLTRNGVIAIVAAASPYREARDQIRHLIDRFIEVYVKCPLEDCEKRDSKGLYRRARDGQVKGLTGVDDPYEEPLHPEVVCETDKDTLEESVEKILDYLKKIHLISE
ncbi:MAG: adenylyl-sulfate kinase [Candidatus Omnitrophica bacterium]|nr:adenylyl-sulfate kinase [Candidatus Omnitrophota bacterium]